MLDSLDYRDLRVGNIIGDIFKGPVRIRAVFRNAVAITGFMQPTATELFHPLPIDDHILSELGFKEYGSMDGTYEYKGMLYQFNDGKLCLGERNIKYLHELQNYLWDYFFVDTSDLKICEQ